jgi:hypothetical protein
MKFETNESPRNDNREVIDAVSQESLSVPDLLSMLRWTNPSEEKFAPVLSIFGSENPAGSKHESPSPTLSSTITRGGVIEQDRCRRQGSRGCLQSQKRFGGTDRRKDS